MLTYRADIRPLARNLDGVAAAALADFLIMPDIDGLEIRAFGRDDVDGWTRTDLQRRHLIDALEKSGDYLAAVLPSGRIVGKIGIRYDEHPGAGNLFQFDVVESFRGRGTSGPGWSAGPSR